MVLGKVYADQLYFKTMTAAPQFLWPAGDHDWFRSVFLPSLSEGWCPQVLGRWVKGKAGMLR